MQIIANAKLPRKIKPLPEPEYLSTGADMNPLCLLEPIGDSPVILCAIAVWTRGVMTGKLEEKGSWVDRFWRAARQELPKAVGCRFGWNTLFFAVPSQDVAKVSKQFGELLVSYQDECLTNFAVLCAVAGSPQHKLDVLDVLNHEIGTQRKTGSHQSFGASQSFEPNGGKLTHLLDGKPYKVK